MSVDASHCEWYRTDERSGRIRNQHDKSRQKSSQSIDGACLDDWSNSVIVMYGQRLPLAMHRDGPKSAIHGLHWMRSSVWWARKTEPCGWDLQILDGVAKGWLLEAFPAEALPIEKIVGEMKVRNDG